MWLTWCFLTTQYCLRPIMLHIWERLPTNVCNHFKFVTQDMLPQKQALHKIHKQHNGLKRALSEGRKTGKRQANQLGFFDIFLTTHLPKAHVSDRCTVCVSWEELSTAVVLPSMHLAAADRNWKLHACYARQAHNHMLCCYVAEHCNQIKATPNPGP